jgi:hypothetical protein
MKKPGRMPAFVISQGLTPGSPFESAQKQWHGFGFWFAGVVPEAHLSERL